MSTHFLCHFTTFHYPHPIKFLLKNIMIRSSSSAHPFLPRKLSFNIFRSWENNCDKVETKPTEVQKKYVIEKSCCPSIFESWKPKVPDLNARNYPSMKTNMMLPYKTKSCVAGMKFKEKNRCEIEATARQCEKMNHPKWLRHCPPRPKYKVDGPLPPLQAAVVKCKESKGQVQQKPVIKSIRKTCEPEVPEGDWNPDGHLH